MYRETMLNQSEINFYIGNKQNILKKDKYRKITCILRYDPGYKLYIIERKTPNSTWTERTNLYDKAYVIYYNFLYCKRAVLENHIKSGKRLHDRIYKNLWGDVIQ